MRQIILSFFALLIGVSTGMAQTVTQKLQFDVADALTATANVTYAIQITPAGATAPNAAVAEKATCISGSATYPSGSTCTIPLPIAVNKGDTIVVTETNAGGSVSSAPFVDPGLPGNVGNIKILITISVP